MRIVRFVGAVIGVLVVVALAFGAWVFSQTLSLPQASAMPGTSQTAAGNEAAAASAEEIADTLMTDHPLPGLSIAAARDGEIVWTTVRGYSDLQTLEPVTPESRFLIGSVSKPLTAVAALHLAETGVLDLDADIRTYVPDFPEKAFPVTARQLLAHQGGIRHYRPAFNLHAPYLPSESGSARVYDTVGHSLDAFAGDALLFEPGTGFQYSTYGYTLLSAALEGASGTAFLDLMEARVFAPAQMARTGADFDAPEPAGRVTDYLAIMGDGRVLTAPNTSQSVKWAGGGLLSTPSDLARFGSALLAGDLIGADAFAELSTPRVLPDGSSPQLYASGMRTAEVTFREGDETPVLLLHHGGTSTGAQAALVIIPEHNLVVAITANAYVGGSQPFIQAGFDIARAFGPGPAAAE